jgi:hypothetical protein
MVGVIIDYHSWEGEGQTFLQVGASDSEKTYKPSKRSYKSQKEKQIAEAASLFGFRLLVQSYKYMNIY